MLFTQFVDDDLGCASYLVGDEAAGEAVIVDPAFAIEQYLEEAERRHVRIKHVLETHTHADHVSGHGRLALEHGIPIAIHSAAEPDFEYHALSDGEDIAVGDVCVEVLHTPGHRPEHCCFAITDKSRADEPWLVLTGDSLLVGDTARPDLAVAAREGAEEMFSSLKRLLELPDGVEVYPGHVAGSLCGGAMSSKASSTIGFERRFNRSLSISAVEEFVNESTGGSAPRPPNMDRIVELNRGPFIGRPSDLEPVNVLDDATVLDVRPADAFLAGHVRGALSVPVSGSSFATKAGFVLSPDERVVIHASSHEEAERAAQGLRSVGFLELGGYLERAPADETMEPLDLDELERLVGEEEIEVLDVREKDERDDAYIVGSRHVPYRLVRAFADQLDPGRPVATICESGSRAIIAASALAAAGVPARPVMNGGVSAWRARGNDTVAFRRCGS